jgi:hypothetical protein
MQIEENVLVSARSYIMKSEFKNALEWLQQFMVYDTGKTISMNLLLSMAHFGAGNPEKKS